MKRLLSLLVTLLLLMSSFMLIACDDTRYASNGLAYKVNKDGRTCTIVGIGNCTDAVINIPEKINRYKVTVIGKDAFVDQSQITEISFPEGLLSIEDGAFDYCTGLTNVVLPNSVTYAGIYTFAHCDNLKSIQLSDSLTEISVQLCYACKSLEEIVIPDGVKVIGDAAFAECPLKSIVLGSGIEKIENFGFMNHGSYGFHPLTLTYNGTLAQWKNVQRGARWIQEEACSFSCVDFNGDIMDVYE